MHSSQQLTNQAPSEEVLFFYEYRMSSKLLD